MLSRPRSKRSRAVPPTSYIGKRIGGVPFARQFGGTLVTLAPPSMGQMRTAMRMLPEHEKERALGTLLGTNEQRCGFWADVPGRTSTAHFWLTLGFHPIPGDGEVNRYVSACGRWDLGKYPSRAGVPMASYDQPRKVFNVGDGRARVCKRCAFHVVQQDA